MGKVIIFKFFFLNKLTNILNFDIYKYLLIYIYILFIKFKIEILFELKKYQTILTDLVNQFFE